jgi:hypothetical protein
MSKTHTIIEENTGSSSIDYKFRSLRESYPPFVPPYPVFLEFSDTLVAPGFTSRFEQIWPPDDSPTDRTKWNDFQHFSCRSGPDSPDTLVAGILSEDEGNYYATLTSKVSATNYALYGGEFGLAGFLDSGLPEWRSSVAVNDFVVVPDDLDALIQRSLTSLLPLIRSELSSFNSLYELKDFKTLPRTMLNIERATRRGNTVSSRRFRLAFRGLRKSLRHLLHASADGYLQSQFNLLPLLSDITGIYRALKRTERRLNDFVTRAGKPQHRHFRVDLATNKQSFLEVLSASPRSSFFLGRATAAMQYQRFVNVDASVFHAEIEYNYNYTQYQLEHARVLALLDAIGVNFNPVIIWNAIPWSFVVDWVLGVNTWLSHQRLGNMDPKINILRYLWSITRRRRILVHRQSSISKDFFNQSGIETSGFVPLPVVHQAAYRRVCGLPPASSFLTSGLSAEELSLGAALVITRRHSPTKRPLWKTQSSYP